MPVLDDRFCTEITAVELGIINFPRIRCFIGCICKFSQKMRNDLVGNRSLVRMWLLQKIDHFSDARKYKWTTSHQVFVTYSYLQVGQQSYNIMYYKRQSHYWGNLKRGLRILCTNVYIILHNIFVCNLFISTFLSRRSFFK